MESNQIPVTRVIFYTNILSILFFIKIVSVNWIWRWDFDTDKKNHKNKHDQKFPISVKNKNAEKIPVAHW